MKRGGFESIIVLMNVKVATAATRATGNQLVVSMTIVKTPKTAKIPKFLRPRMTRVDSVTMAEVVTGKLDCCLLTIR